MKLVDKVWATKVHYQAGLISHANYIDLNDALARRILIILAGRHAIRGCRKLQPLNRRQPPAKERPEMNQRTIPAPVPLRTSALTVMDLPMDDPRVRPLLDELAVEYDTRYADLFGRGAAAEELNATPPGNSLPRTVPY